MLTYTEGNYRHIVLSCVPPEFIWENMVHTVLSLIVTPGKIKLSFSLIYCLFHRQVSPLTSNCHFMDNLSESTSKQDANILFDLHLLCLSNLKHAAFAFVPWHWLPAESRSVVLQNAPHSGFICFLPCGVFELLSLFFPFLLFSIDRLRHLLCPPGFCLYHIACMMSAA